MNLNINPNVWKKVFALPNEIVDSHIKLAGAVQLKVLLWIFSHNGDDYSINDISSALGIASADINDALQYWFEHDIFLKDFENIPMPIAQETKIEIEKPTETPQKQNSTLYTPKLPPVAPPPSKPTLQDVIKRVGESPELKHLFNIAQTKLGKTISHGEQSTLLWLHDWQGLPIEIILMIIEYAVVEGKTGMAYIEKVGIDWANSEIDTIEKAEERLNTLTNQKKCWTKICKIFDIPQRKASKRELEYVHNWVNVWKMDDEVILLAYEECVNHTQKFSFSYINKILEKWYTNGITTSKQATTFNANKKPFNKKNFQKPQTEASYDIDEFEKMSLNQPLVYKKEV